MSWRGDQIDEAIAIHTPLVRSTARSMARRLPPSVDVNDLVQAGMIGLLEAATRYDEARGIPFEPYALPRIRGEMLDELRRMDWVPLGARALQRDIAEAVRSIEQRQLRKPTEAEIARRVGISMLAYRRSIGATHDAQMVYIEDLNERVEAIERTLRDPEADPLERLAAERYGADLALCIDALPSRERRILSLYYDDERTMREIADLFGVTESRICQLHRQAIDRLRIAMQAWEAAKPQKAANGQGSTRRAPLKRAAQ